MANWVLPSAGAGSLAVELPIAGRGQAERQPVARKGLPTVNDLGTCVGIAVVGWGNV
jgi:hypothetical protein